MLSILAPSRSFWDHTSYHWSSQNLVGLHLLKRCSRLKSLILWLHLIYINRVLRIYSWTQYYKAIWSLPQIVFNIQNEIERFTMRKHQVILISNFSYFLSYEIFGYKMFWHKVIVIYKLEKKAKTKFSQSIYYSDLTTLHK